MPEFTPIALVDKIALFNSHPLADIIRPFMAHYQQHKNDDGDEVRQLYPIELVESYNHPETLGFVFYSDICWTNGEIDDQPTRINNAFRKFHK